MRSQGWHLAPLITLVRPGKHIDMIIVSHDLPLQTTDPDSYDLALGQRWERELAKALEAQGFRCYQPKQKFIFPEYERKASRMALRFPERAASFRKRHHCKSFLRPWQLDLVCHLGKQRWNIEVKALTPKAFQQHQIHIGLVEKYDLKEVPVDLLALINQETCEVFYVPYAPETWSRHSAIRGQGMDYVIHRHTLTPLQAWVDFVKQS
jgi:hypothetical protein